MPDINDLVSSKLKGHAQENISLAKEKCREAKNLLNRYNSGDTDKALINQALELYEESIGLYSKLMDAYIGVAYISASVGRLAEAIGYLNTALDIEPANQEIRLIHAELLKEWEKEKISEIISKESGKSLSRIISSHKEPKSSIMQKFSSIMFSGMVKKKAKLINTQIVTGKTLNYASPGAVKSAPTPTAKGDFFDMINKAKSGLNNK